MAARQHARSSPPSAPPRPPAMPAPWQQMTLRGGPGPGCAAAPAVGCLSFGRGCEGWAEPPPRTQGLGPGHHMQAWGCYSHNPCTQLQPRRLLLQPLKFQPRLPLLQPQSEEAARSAAAAEKGVHLRAALSA